MLKQPLIVDLDGTLIKTDILYENANSFICSSPEKAPLLLKWLLSGKSTLKDELSERTGVDASTLPYNDELLNWLQDEKSNGREIVLATASHHIFAEQVAKHLKLFDLVLATDKETNLRGQNKADTLIKLYGEKGYDYVGDCHADLPVWESANVSHLVGTSKGLINDIKKVSTLGHVFKANRSSRIEIFIKAIRLHQWIKNLLIFVPLLAAHSITDLNSVIITLLAFLAFGLTASSVYILNDLVDVQDDRHHHSKRKRPFASGDLSLVHGWLTWPCLLIAALLLSLMLLPFAFFISLVSYYTLTLAYSFTLKRKAIIDVITLAMLYTIRIIAGATATATIPSYWLLAFSIFIFFSLALIKRYSELKTAREIGKERLRGRGYLQEDLEAVSAMGTSSGYISVLVFALYIQDPNTAHMYSNTQFLWAACPILVYWISRAWLITHRGEMHDDPIVFAIKDKPSWLVGTLFVLVFVLAGVTL
ncbi:UbiA family prenyltransferase [Marinomonas epiphytica]